MKERSKSSEQPTDQAQAPTAGSLAEFASLLKGSSPPADDTAPDEAPADDEAPTKPKAGTKPKDITEAATLLGIEAADLYALQIPSAQEGAEPYTLGKLKDLAAEHDDFALRSLQADEAARVREQKFMRAEQELADLFAALPPDAIKPEIREKLQRRRDAALVQERQRTLEVIPEWREPTKRTEEIQSINEHLRDYGFSETYFASVHDHRTIRYIRENWKREVQIRAALEKVTERKNNPPPKSKQNAAPSKKKAAPAVPREQRAAAQFTRIIQQSSNRS